MVKTVIGLVRLSTANASFQDVFNGFIYTFRLNFLRDGMTHTDLISIGDSYQFDRMASINWLHLGNKSTDWVEISPCRFKYNDQYYGGLVFIAKSQSYNIVIDGVTGHPKSRFSPFMVDYMTGNTITNQEIYNSIGTTLNTDYRYADSSVFNYNDSNDIGKFRLSTDPIRYGDVVNDKNLLITGVGPQGGTVYISFSNGLSGNSQVAILASYVKANVQPDFFVVSNIGEYTNIIGSTFSNIGTIEVATGKPDGTVKIVVSRAYTQLFIMGATQFTTWVE